MATEATSFRLSKSNGDANLFHQPKASLTGPLEHWAVAGISDGTTSKSRYTLSKNSAIRDSNSNEHKAKHGILSAHTRLLILRHKQKPVSLDKAIATSELRNWTVESFGAQAG